MTTALSPARTRSIITTLRSAANPSAVVSTCKISAIKGVENALANRRQRCTLYSHASQPALSRERASPHASDRKSARASDTHNSYCAFSRMREAVAELDSSASVWRAIINSSSVGIT